MGKKKILFDEKRHGDKIDSRALVVSGYVMTEIKALIDSPTHEIHGLDAWIETDAKALDEKVLQLEGFMNASNNDITFKNYTSWRKSLNKSKVMIKIGSSSPAHEELATNDLLQAFIKKFDGKDNLFFSPRDKVDDYYIKNIEELEELTWVNLKKYLKDHNIDKPYDLRTQAVTKEALYADIESGVYNDERS